MCPVSDLKAEKTNVYSINNALGQTHCDPCVCLSVVSLFQVVRYSVRARLTAAALRQSEQNTHTHTDAVLGEVCTLVFIGHGWCSEQRSPEKSLYIHHAPFPVQHTSTHKHTHTERLQLFRSSLPMCVLACA